MPAQTKLAATFITICKKSRRDKAQENVYEKLQWLFYCDEWQPFPMVLPV